MQELFILGVVVLTSAAAGVFAVRGLAWSVGALAAAVRATLEFVGAGLVFFVLNLVVGVATILILRTLSGGPVSVSPISSGQVIDPPAPRGLSRSAGAPAKKTSGSAGLPLGCPPQIGNRRAGSLRG